MCSVLLGSGTCVRSALGCPLWKQGHAVGHTAPLRPGLSTVHSSLGQDGSLWEFNVATAWLPEARVNCSQLGAAGPGLSLVPQHWSRLARPLTGPGPVGPLGLSLVKPYMDDMTLRLSTGFPFPQHPCFRDWWTRACVLRQLHMESSGFDPLQKTLQNSH